MNRRTVMRELAQDPTLEDIVLESHRRGGTSTAAEIAEALNLQDYEVTGRFEDLVRLGMVIGDQSQAQEIDLTPTGRLVAQEVVCSWQAGDRRTEAIRRAVLQAFDEGRANSESMAANWPGDPRCEPVDHQDIAEAFEYLEDAGMIRARGAASGRWLGISRTAKGSEALSSRHSLASDDGYTGGSSYFSETNSMTFGDHAQVGAAAAGSGNSVQGQVSIDSSALEEVRRALEEALQAVDQLPVSDQGEAREGIEAAAAVAAADAPEKKILTTIIQGALSRVGSDAGGAVAAALGVALRAAAGM